MKTQIRELEKEALAASGLPLDHRFKKWVKWVDAVDLKGQDGYAFKGELVKSGTVEVEVGRPRILLVAATSGSAKYQTTHYRALRFEADGTLTPTDVKTDNGKDGWALRIRDAVARLVADCATPAQETDLDWLKAHLPDITEADIIGAALAHYRRYVESQAQAIQAHLAAHPEDPLTEALAAFEFYAVNMEKGDDTERAHLRAEAAAELPAFATTILSAGAAATLTAPARALYETIVFNNGILSDTVCALATTN